MKAQRTTAVVVLLAGALGASASTAAIVKNSGWTESKANRVVVRDATVRLSPLQRAPLQQKLLAAVRQFSALEQGALDEENSLAAAKAHSLAYRYSSLLRKVRDGLGLEQAACSGFGPAVGGLRFTRFRCHVTSEQLEIPWAQPVISADGQFTDMVVGTPERIDAVVAWLMVQTTGRSSITHRQPAYLLAEG
jgi:hypothetical protein